MNMKTMAVILVAAAAVYACSNDDHSHDHPNGGHSSPHPACHEIITACHPVDLGLGPINDCHSLGHDAKSNEECVPRREECLRICAEAAADGGSGDASSD
jgi:hypothetical protein